MRYYRATDLETTITHPNGHEAGYLDRDIVDRPELLADEVDTLDSIVWPTTQAWTVVTFNVRDYARDAVTVNATSAAEARELVESQLNEPGTHAVDAYRELL